ncbi:galactitol-1-phosphate 5-dehydrogenase [Chromatiales bacterium (ex Bugula neritina AB1)]|nr:galactitol-1-phosphate 5-dehydrogenase [Chromatiales bacterium (ex Bugula neritina AB1)]
MKALVYTGTEQVQYRDEPTPGDPVGGEVLIQIDACGLCGSDMHAYHGLDARRVPPLILGHEATGVVKSGPRSGERVILNPLISCGKCFDCLSGRTNLCADRELIGMRMPGAFAEQIVIPEQNLLAMPADMNVAHASLTEPTAVSLHCVALVEAILARPISEARALVIGAGAIGALAALVLQGKGCSEVFIGDTNSLRRATAEKYNFGQVYDPLSTEPPAGSFDVVIDAVGSGRTRSACSRLVKAGGVICHAGLQDDAEGLDTRRLTLQEVTFIGAYTYTVADLMASVDAIYNGKLGSLEWIESRPLSDGASAFSDVHNGVTGAPKIVLFT